MSNFTWSIVFFVIFGGFYSIFTKKEIYPFAPYSMYSYIHDVKKMEMIELFFVNQNNELIKVQTRDISPFDESRVKKIFMNILWKKKSKNPENLNEDMNKILKSIYMAYSKNKKNDPDRHMVMTMHKIKWGDLDALRKGIPKHSEEMARYENY